MAVITNKDFAVPLAGFDSVTKGPFTITRAHMIWNDDDDNRTSRASGTIIITGANDNPLFKLGATSPIRLQGIVASVMFGTEKRFIKFLTIKDFDITNDEIVREMDLDVIFEILPGNLEYLEGIIEYKDQNHL